MAAVMAAGRFYGFAGVAKATARYWSFPITGAKHASWTKAPRGPANKAASAAKNTPIHARTWPFSNPRRILWLQIGDYIDS